MNISSLILPVIVVIIIIYGLYKKVDIFNVFVDGVKEGLEMSIGIFPTILAMLVAINVLIKSNIIIDISNLLLPFLNFINFPHEILPLAILKPISGSSSLIFMDSLLKSCGPDSYIGRIASVIQGSTDTTIYILGLYFGSIGIKKTRYALKVGLIADFITIVIAIVVINFLFK